MQTQSFIRFDAVEKSYDGENYVVRGLHLDIQQGEFLTLLGPSGSGKTTVLMMLAGFETPTSGAIYLDGQRIDRMPAHRRNIGVVFQNYALFPHMSVADNVAFPLRMRRLDRSDTEERVRRALDMVRMLPFQQRRPSQLSGGQQQRVALARAVFTRPQLLLLDEPLSALDRATGDEVREELRSLVRTLAIPAYIVSHDRTDALTLADRTVLLDQGRILQSGTTRDVFDAPATPAAARLVGIDTILLGRIAEVDNGLARIVVAGQDIRAEAPAPAGHEAALCIRAEDVAIARHDVADTSVMNQWRAVVRSETPEGPFVRVGLDCGFRLFALVTRDAWRRLALKPGDVAWAIVKAATIRALPR
jgi:putative spermidine/putrescine transport system ATP-binding protein